MFCKWPSFTPHFSIQGETKQVPGTIHNFAKGKPKQNSSKLSLAEPSRAKQLIPHYHSTVPPPC